MPKKVSIVIPVYFNEESLDDLFKELEALEDNLRKRNYLLELVFVDDCSTDNSYELLQKKITQIKTVSKNINFLLLNNLNVFQKIIINLTMH